MNALKPDPTARHLPPQPSIGSFVGYIRVSTARQAEKGGSLEAQAAELAAYADARQATLYGPYRDDLSAFNAKARTRPGLHQAIDQARRLRVPLLVTDIDRLSRNSQDLRLLLEDNLSTYTTRQGLVDQATLKAAVAKAQVQSEQKSRRATEQKSVLVTASGWVAPQGFAEGRRAGAQANKERARLRENEVADFLRSHPEANELSHKDLAAQLNAAGIQNLKSVAGVRMPWTKEALRPVRGRAKQILSAEHPKSPEDDPRPATAPLRTSQGLTGASHIGAVRDMPRDDLIRNTLSSEVSARRPLNEFEREALRLVIIEDVKGAKIIGKLARDTLIEILKKPQKEIKPEHIKNIHRFVQKRLNGCVS